MIVAETSSLFLREMGPDDFGALHAVYSDALAMKHYPHPFDSAMTTAWSERSGKSYRTNGFGRWSTRGLVR